VRFGAPVFGLRDKETSRVLAASPARVGARDAVAAMVGAPASIGAGHPVDRHPARSPAHPARGRDRTGSFSTIGCDDLEAQGVDIRFGADSRQFTGT
jgi:hypothetical protein